MIAVFLTSILFPVALSAQSLPSGISPALIAELQSMSPADQRRYAQQYGISIPDNNLSSSNLSELATPGEALTSAIHLNEAPIEIDSTILEEEESTEPTRFGRDIFNADISTFAPTDDSPVPDSYKLGVGDNLTVQLYGKENEQFELQIGRSGDVFFPKLGPILLSGLTFDEARSLIKNRVAQELIGVDAVVGMGRLRAINVFMAGEVVSPGAYSVSALTTLTQAVYQAGGITEIGSLRQIQVRRNGSLLVTFDAYDLLLKGDSTNDIHLASGDVVYVPPFKTDIDIRGAVKRPMRYELVGDESLGDIIAMAGSFTRKAFPASTLITRKNDQLGVQDARTVDLSAPGSLELPVQNGDVIMIPEINEQISASVLLKGAVARPGTYGWFEGQRFTEIVSDARRDLQADADLSLGMIVRQKNAMLDIEVISFDMGEALKSPGSAADPILMEFDEILVFSLVTADILETVPEEGASQQTTAEEIYFQQLSLDEEVDDGLEEDTNRNSLLEPIILKLRSQARQNEPVQTVSISGAVRAPGEYPLTENATIQTLISAAGGLKDSAFLDAAELRRILVRSRGQATADYEEVNLTQLQGNLELPLQSRDHLTVREIPDWSPNDAIIIEGEVRFPGTYLIRRGERLSDVIKRAGGLTEDASPDAAIFTRQEVAEQENLRAEQFKREIQNTFASRLLTAETTTQNITDVSDIIASLEQFESKGRLLIDLTAALGGAVNADLNVSDGDRLIIPKVSKTVTVVGEVKRSGTHTFNEMFTLEDYLELSAGLTKRADGKGIYIVKANGSVITLKTNLWRFSKRNSNLDPGDTIVVPIDTQYKDILASWREITQVVYQSVVSIAAVARL